MSPTPALKRPAVSIDARRADPRSHPRYPIALELRYKLLRRGRVEYLGAGRTLNMSSGGVLFERTDQASKTSESALAGGIVELAVSWPFLLGDTCNLKLVMRGQIVRSESKLLAMKIDRYEFRTAGSGLRDAAEVLPKDFFNS